MPNTFQLTAEDAERLVWWALVAADEGQFRNEDAVLLRRITARFRKSLTPDANEFLEWLLKKVRDA